MASRFTTPITQFVNDDASDIGAGWKLNFYGTGTLVRKDTFSDNDLSSANANPVVADSAGRFASIFLESGTYRVVLTDADDVEKWDEDPVAGSIGSSGVVEAKTDSYSLTSDDATKLLTMDATAGAKTFTLLAAGTAGDGFEVSFKKIDTSSNAVTVDGNGSETIDGSTTFVLTNQYDVVTLRSDGSNWFLVARDTPTATLRPGLLNAGLAAGVAASALTVSLKGWDGADPATDNIVSIPFRSATAGTGTTTKRDITAATSVVISSGSTLGATSGTPFRLWIVALDNAGTVGLGVINAVGEYPLRDNVLEDATAEGGAGASDATKIIYATAAHTDDAMRIIGYMDWNSGLTTAGTWDAAPDVVQMFHDGITLPGGIIQTQYTATTATASGTTVLPIDDTIPQNTEGNEFITEAFVPQSATSRLLIDVVGVVGSGTGSISIGIALFQDSTAGALAAVSEKNVPDGTHVLLLRHEMLAATSASTTFKMRAGLSGAGTIRFNGVTGRLFGGVCASSIRVTEYSA